MDTPAAITDTLVFLATVAAHTGTMATLRRVEPPSRAAAHP